MEGVEGIGPNLGTQDLHTLFQLLSEELERRGETAHLFVVGGAAMALRFDDLRSTRDVDAVFEPVQVVRDAVATVSSSAGLPPDWLNDAVKGFLPGADNNPETVFESSSLLVQVPSDQYLLATKAFAARDHRDLADAAVIFNRANLADENDIVDLLSSYYPQRLLQPRHFYVADEIVSIEEHLGEGVTHDHLRPTLNSFKPPEMGL
mgnify:CR=1 FL=1